ncbi:MAG: DUF1570 domain-containing protein [Planctomycetia bacterium]|jgi:hypothetical protein
MLPPPLTRWSIGLLASLGPFVAGTTAAEPGAFATVEARQAAGVRTLAGRIVIEAVDGGMLLELPDQRYELLPPESIVSRTALPDEPAREAPRDLGRRILADLPAGFDVHLSRHYVICFNTSREYAKWVAALFERLHEAFTTFWKNAGLDVAEPDQPLIVVIFSDRQQYETFATRDVGPAADRVVGYYNLASNRVTTFDLTGSDVLTRQARRPPGRVGPEILASPEAAGLVATLVHEATHQMAFNCGMHRRLAPIPLWLSEGIATYFETPDLSSPRGWKGIGIVNRPRLERFLKTAGPGWARGLVIDDGAFRAADTAEDAYARAWALTHFLAQTRKPKFTAYLRRLAATKPLADDSAEQRERDFEAAFGDTPAAVEEAVHRSMARLQSRLP